MTDFYDFRIGDRNVGFIEFEQSPQRVAFRTRFRMDGEDLDFNHEVELKDGQPTRFRAGNGDWFHTADYPEGAAPTAGVSILLDRMATAGLDEFDYPAVNESDGEFLGPTRLRREDDWILEERDGRVWRRFQMEAGKLVRFDWGGPISTLRGSEQEAREGSPYALRIASEGPFI